MTSLTTERLILRPPRDGDEDAVFTIHSDPRTYQHRPELAMKNREEASKLLRLWQHNWAEDGIGYFVVVREPADIIGFTGLRFSEEQGEQVLNLYYRFAPEAQGKGYAAEAAAAAIEWARQAHPERPVVAIIDPSNAPSTRLAEKLGLHLQTANHEQGQLYRTEDQAVLEAK